MQAFTVHQGIVAPMDRDNVDTDAIIPKQFLKSILRTGFGPNLFDEWRYLDKEIVRNLDGTFDIVPEQTTDEVCDVCGAPMTIKRGRFGSFLACTKYPECKNTKPISLGVKCPREGCGGFIAEKRSRRGKPFYGCSNWKKKGCDFVVWDRPIPQACPDCQAKFVVKKENKRGVTLRCLNCDWKQGADEEESAA